MTIDREKLVVMNIVIYGTTSFASFRMEQHYQGNRETNFLPTRIVLEINHSLLGNKIIQKIESDLSYKKIKTRKEDTSIKKTYRTRYLSMTPDSVKVITDSVYWNNIRSQNKYSYINQEKDSVK